MANDISNFVETFSGPWPEVLVDMQEFVELSFMAAGTKKRAASVRVFIARALVPQSSLQPHIARFRQTLSALPGCQIELKGSDQSAHRIEIQYRR